MTGESKLLEGLVERWVADAGMNNIDSDYQSGVVRRLNTCAAQLKALIPQAVAAAKLEERQTLAKELRESGHAFRAEGYPDIATAFINRAWAWDGMTATNERLAAATGEECHERN